MGARGPLPDPRSRRRNAPTIPSTNLPISGRKGDPPAPPSWIKLNKSGRAFWRWAWAQPQAVAWGVGTGQEAVIARRAALEDDLAAIELVKGIDFTDADSERDITGIVQRVASLATGRLQLMKEMRELDDRLGLTPKGMAALRWVIVADAPAEDEQPEPAPQPAGVTSISSRRDRLTGT